MTHKVLYRKYRPLNFESLVGQDHIKSILVESIQSESFSHAYLFCGPRGTGKTTTARLFARAINDPNFVENGDLSNELDIENFFNSPDILEMDAASNRGIEDIRELKDSVNFLPASLKYKVYIIDEAHMLTKEAFNALLKTLEEPPNHVVFILATTEPSKLPVTILSRVLRFDFVLATKEKLLQKLRFIAKEEGLEIDDEALNKIYDVSGGSFRDAESILTKLYKSNSKITAEDVHSVLGILSNDELVKSIQLLKGNDFKLLIKFLNELENKNIDYEKVVEAWINYIIESEDVSLLQYIDLLLDIYKGIRKFSDKKLYIRAKLLSSAVPATSEVKAVEKIIETQKKPNPPKVESKQKITEAKEVSEIEKNNDSALAMSGLIDSMGKIDKRIEAIFKISELSVKEDMLVIKNKFKFNINYLDKNKKKILDLVKDKSVKKLELKVEDVKVDIDAVIEKEISQPKINPEVKAVAVVVSLEEDNSDLIEELL